MFTKMGPELSTLVEPMEVPGFFDYIASQYENAGIKHSAPSVVTIAVPKVTL